MIDGLMGYRKVLIALAGMACITGLAACDRATNDAVLAIGGIVGAFMTAHGATAIWGSTVPTVTTGTTTKTETTTTEPRPPTP